METMQRHARREALQAEIENIRSARLIVNTQSRRGQVFCRLVEEALKQRGFNIDACYSVNDPARLPEVVAHAKQEGCKLLIVGGGDGTLSSVVDHLAYEDIVLGVVPLGTGNGFARSLGIPMDLEGTIDVICKGRVREIDLGVVNGDYFANIISIGFNAHVVDGTPGYLKKALGVLAYAISGLKEIFQNRPFACDLFSDGKKLAITTRQIIVANGAFYGISKVSKKARLDDGQLIVCALDSTRKGDIVKFWWALLRGDLPSHEAVHLFNATNILCHASPPKAVDVDGEITFKTPISVSVAPKALLVMAPR